MTIRDVIAAVTQQRQPGLNEEEYLRVISDVDMKALREVIEPRGGELTDAWTAYTMEDADKELLIPAPYDKVYVHACCAEIDDRENQIGNLSNASRFFYSKFGDYAKWYLRTHRPAPKRLHSRWFGI